MAEAGTFADLMRRVKRGDVQAAEALIREYEPEIRIIVKRKLSPKLRRELESMDVCQSVLKDFFFRAGAQHRDHESPKQLLAYLARMVENKLTDKARRMDAEKRPKMAGTPLDDAPPPVDSQTPSQIVAAAELREQIQRALSPEEWELFRRRGDGESWEEIATALGLSAGAARKRWAGAIELLRMRLVRNSACGGGVEPPSA